jgi:hypothetical protein
MFGWLASFGMHSRARSTPITRWLAVTPRSLFEGLGQLGGVLYLAPRSVTGPQRERTPVGCLVESAELTPLLSTSYVGLTCAITTEGPREWIDCVSREGDALARIYLLPDTDYLAWDGLFADGQSIAEPEHRKPDREWLRASRARILCFTRRRLAGFTLVGAIDAPISSLGRHVARDIAVAESVGIAVV